jgi:hypothetical protein
MQQQLFHSLRNAKQQTTKYKNLTKVNGIHETKLEKIYETKRNLNFHETKRNETKRNFAVFVFRETSEISRNNFFVSLCFVFRETKKWCEMETLTRKCYAFCLERTAICNASLQIYLIFF